MKLFKKRKKVHKYINGSKGVVSLFLCLLMTPVLSVASALVEFSRYQNTESVFQEVMDCASLSTMANYDAYLQKRFGLFAVSQDCDIGAVYGDSLRKNSAVMEGVSLGDEITAGGTLPLSETDVIKRQILDFSESTVLTEIILEDLHLQDLLDELDKLMNISGMLDVLDSMSNMTTKVRELVESGEAFLERLNTAVTQVETLKTNVTAFASSIADLCRKIREDGTTIDYATPESETSSLEAVAEKYLTDIQAIYDNTAALIDSVTALKETVTGIPDALEALKTDYEEAAAAVAAVSDSFSDISQSSHTGSAGEGSGDVQDVSDDATSLYEELLKDIKKAIDDAAEDFSNSTIDALKSAADGFAQKLVDELGLDVAKRWNLTEYYRLPLSDDAKADLKDLLSVMPEVWEDGSYDGLIQLLKEKYVPNAFFEIDFSEIKNVLYTAIDYAKSQFVADAQKSVGEILTNLVNTITSLFSLDVFYDGSLNAFLDDETISTLLSDSGYRGGEEDNPYVNLLNAISSMIGAVNTFVDSIGSLNFFGMIDGIAKLINSIKETVTAIVNLTAKTVEKIGELVGWVANGEWENFGELLLMAGYMTHNLPNRTLAGRKEVSVNGGVSYQTILDGETLTGFPYADIQTPAKQLEGGLADISALAGFLERTQTGGTDQMFRGAELEYILAGTPSEVMNQAVVFMQIYFLRLLLDLVPVFTDPAVSTMAASATIACWAVYLIVAFAEPLCDTVLLVNGSEQVNFIKRSCYLTPTGVDNFLGALTDVISKSDAIKDSAKDTMSQAISGKLGAKAPNVQFMDGVLKSGYDTHCLILLMFTTTTDDMLRRLANIVQLEANYHYTQSDTPYTFDIARAYTGISASADAEFDSFIRIFQTSGSDALIKKRFTRTQTY